MGALQPRFSLDWAPRRGRCRAAEEKWMGVPHAQRIGFDHVLACRGRLVYLLAWKSKRKQKNRKNSHAEAYILKGLRSEACGFDVKYRNFSVHRSRRDLQRRRTRLLTHHSPCRAGRLTR
uniref:Uncharacterized protein n=1 Tax=Setaria italica TaxID=4555 RepID=K3XN94_SETIT